MKMLKSAIFVIKNLKINMSKVKIIIKLEVRDQSQFTGKYRGAAHSICNSKYSVPKKSSIVIHN